MAMQANRAWNSDWKVAAATAGFVFFAILASGAAVLGVARTVWLDPIFGRDAAVAIELTIILPFAWYASIVVVKGMQLSLEWQAAVIMAVTTFLLLMGAYVALAAAAFAEADPVTNGSLGLGIAVQALVSVFPLASRCVIRTSSTTL
jgi:hypothetical protein